MINSTVGIKVRIKLRIIIQIALLSSYMFFDFETQRKKFHCKIKEPTQHYHKPPVCNLEKLQMVNMVVTASFYG
jgi:hypothetical protein